VRERFEFQITRAHHKTRLEDFLLERFENLSKMYLRDTVKTEQCEVNGRNENRGYLLRENDFVEVEIDPARETSMRPQNIPLEIVFEDASIIVVNKSSGMLVHPTHAEKNGTMLNALAYHLNRDKIESGNGLTSVAFIRPGLIHRLDRHTSGLVVVAKTPRAHQVLSDHFQRKLVDKTYLALVDGVVKEDSGTIEAPIGRFAELKFWDVNPEGKQAVTRYQVRKRFDSATLLELEPVTGRTNQLRIHCAHIGHPITGDVDRGGNPFSRVCLHAWKLSFWHPGGGKRLEFAVPIPNELIAFNS
jgi:23S rRNA pseudouridine1911/1915/1917 synthase